MSHQEYNEWLNTARLDIIVHNAHHKLTFECCGDIFGVRFPFVTQRLYVLGVLHPFDSSLTIPMPHQEYNE
eukprot:scaffold248404_cov65-Cyclotella_meneghiniana.AAC.1